MTYTITDMPDPPYNYRWLLTYSGLDDYKQKRFTLELSPIDKGFVQKDTFITPSEDRIIDYAQRLLRAHKIASIERLAQAGPVEIKGSVF